MAQSAAQVQAGRPLVYLAPWVSNQQSLSPVYVEVGHTEVVGWSPTMENFDIESEQATGIIKTVPVKDGHTIKIPALESRADLLQIALCQTGSPSGTTPDFTVQISDRVERYYSIKIVAPGSGTTKVRTFTFWKCQITGMDEYQFGKKTVQKVSMTFRVMRDDTEGGSVGLYGRMVEA